MRLLEKLVGILAPFECINCGQEGEIVCNNCSSGAFPAIPSRCYRCHTATIDFKLCERCKRVSKLSQVWVRTELRGIPRSLLHAFKFDRAQAASKLLAARMGQLINLPENTIVVPIPTATSRVRERGYDHARLMGRDIANSNNLRLVTGLSRLDQARQVGAKRDVRLSQLKGAFRVSQRRLIVGAHILLVDDVLTTGATLEEAALTLKMAGAKKVDAIVFAQA